MTPLATVMRRLLTGYAVSFNRRHRRHGQLFQNRYKSILCQEDAYLRELVRYIHLNPLRVRLVKDLKEFAEGLENLKRACDDVGRDYDEISRTAFGLPGQWRESEEVRALEAAGADRVVLWLPAEGSIDVVLKEMESIASDLL